MTEMRAFDADATGTENDSSANIAAFSDQKLTSGFVYFIRSGRSPTIKIGWALDPCKRLDQLQTGTPHKLHLIGFAPGSRPDEREWHNIWMACHVRGEWFNLTNELRDAINDRLFQPDATRFIHIKTDWRAIRREKRGEHRFRVAQYAAQSVQEVFS